MTTRTRTYRACDGCGNSELDGAQIVQTRPKYRGLPEIPETLDLCDECEGAEKYICNLCNTVHDDDHPCEWQKPTAPIERGDRSISDAELNTLPVKRGAAAATG